MKTFPINAIIFSVLTAITFTNAQAEVTDQGTTAPAEQQAAVGSDASLQNKKAGDTFMQENSKKEGVVTLPSGLQYKIVKAGTGPKPGANDTVTVNYEGSLLNGQVFDSSYKRGESITFPVSGVISGWQEALQLMPVGSTWMLYIPPNLAYGEAGAGDVIGPNETLVFKVELLSVK